MSRRNHYKLLDKRQQLQHAACREQIVLIDGSITRHIVSNEMIFAEAIMAHIRPENIFRNEDFLLYRLANVARRVSQLCASAYEREFDLSLQEWRLLAQVGRFGSISPSQVREHTSMERVAISRATARCRKNGLLVERTHPKDRRVKLYALTPKGRKLYKCVVPRAVALADTVEQGLSARQAAMLKALLAKLELHIQCLDGLQQIPQHKTLRKQPSSIRVRANRRP